jgi:8-oxo-dGTP pyrophosphatase MutT (NUDIX family)
MKENEYREFIEALPEAPGILCRDLYFNSAVVVPFVLIDHEYHLLFQKRAADIRQGSEICFPGGSHDPGLDPDFRETAIRETMEELGITRDRIIISGRLGTLVTPRGVIVETFIGRLAIDTLAELRPAPGEVEELFSIPISWFIDHQPEIYFTRVEVQPSTIGPDGKEQILLPVEELGLPAKYGQNRKGMNYRVVVYKTGKYLVWGITAAIIFELVQKMGKKGKMDKGPFS